MKRNQRAKFLGVLAAFLAGASWAQAQTITANLAAPPGSVNTNGPGIKMRIYQGNSRLALSAAAPAESLISGKAIDPGTGAIFENTATPNPVGGSFIYFLDKFINLHEQIPNNPDITGGNFFKGAPDPRNIGDEAVPGIPGTGGGGDYFAAEFTGYLQLPAGTVRVGVNSDDGFKLTIGAGVNPLDPGALQVAILDGTRGFANTEVNLTVNQAGLYPFRLLWWENTGANSGIEFYNFAPGTTSGNIYLVGDTASANALKVYREALISPPIITFADPRGSQTGVAPAPYMRAEITDGLTSVTAASVKFLIDGTNFTPTVTKAGEITQIAVQAPLFRPNTVHTNTVIYADSAGTSYTNSWSYTIFNYPAILPEYTVASVIGAKRGFKVKVHQMDINRNPQTGVIPNVERQIANGYIDPVTGQPYPNTADLSATETDGYFLEPAFINWNQDSPAASGNFTSANGFEDKPVPGFPGGNNTERYVASIETILELKAGAYRFGVNSDDGFRLSFGRGPGDVVGVQLGTAGDRGAVDSLIDAVIPVDGFYPVRLMWFETGGGAACEFFVVDLPTGNKTLINDDAGFTPIKAYQESTVSRPYISRTLPAVNYAYAIADQDLEIDITDGAIPVDAGSIKLTLNGTAQNVTPTKTGNVTKLVRQGSLTSLLPSGANNVVLVYGYASGASVVNVTNNWSYTVPAYTVPIPAGNKVAAGTVSGSGFKFKNVQIDRSGDANQGNGGRYVGNGGGGNNMPRPEIQLANGYINPTNNSPYPNLADLSLAGADGLVEVPEVLNFNNAAGGAAANAGIFNSDTSVPGLPGRGTSNSGLDNSVHEITTYLNLKAGAHLFGLNVDDGFTISSAPNPRDTLGTLLGRRDPGGGQNATLSANAGAAFNVIVPEDGIYPFRILFWEGGGGVNLEFLKVDRNTGTQVLVNDAGGAFPSTIALGGNLSSDVTAFSTYTGLARPWVKFSVYPLSSLWQNQHQQSGPGPILVKTPGGNPADIANDVPTIRPFGDSVGAVVAELGSGTVGMLLDGAVVTPTVTDVAGSSDKLVSYTPNPRLASGSTHTAGLIYAGTTNFWTFTVITYTNVAAGVSVPAGSADPNARGFRAKVVQAASGQANTVVRAENQLAGNPANVAAAGPGPGGAYLIPGIINWSTSKVPGNTGADTGNFTTALTGDADAAVPGLPGTGLSGAARFENAAAEIFAYLDLPAGYQKFGVNGDDGWAVKIGKPGETNGMVLFTTDRGAGNRDIPFAFITPEAGLYPVRLVWYQGGGGGNVEFFSYGPNNEKIAINANNPNAIKAYHSLKTVTTVPKLALSVLADGKVRLTFEGKLQSSDSLSPVNWIDVTGAASPLDVTPGAGQKYWRAVNP